MPYSEADTVSFGPRWGKMKQIMSKYASLTTRTVVSHNSETSASVGNPVSYAQADGNGNMSSVITG